MSLLTTVLDILSRGPQELLYYTQGATYGLACWSIHRGHHAPWQIYLASCVIHLGLGLLHHWPHP